MGLNDTHKGGIDCGHLRRLIYVDYTYHAFNLLMSLINLSGLNNKICFANLVIAILIFELVILAWKQFRYFHAQQEHPSCMELTPFLYWWQFLQILSLYVGFAGIICFFFRKFFPSDDAIAKQENFNKEDTEVTEDNETPDKA